MLIDIWTCVASINLRIFLTAQKVYLTSNRLEKSYPYSGRIFVLKKYNFIFCFMSF